jgi:hypothetical protein
MRRQSIRSQISEARREIAQLGHHSGFVIFFFGVPVMLALFRSLFPFRNRSALLDDPMAIEATAHPSTQRVRCRRAAATRTPTKSGKSMCASVLFGPLVMEKSVGIWSHCTINPGAQ